MNGKASGWLVKALAVMVLLIGLTILAGGAWLIALGGSPYYLLAGLGPVSYTHLDVYKRQPWP